MPQSIEYANHLAVSCPVPFLRASFRGQQVTPPTGEVYLRVAEAAKLLHVSPKTLDRWAREGRVPYIVTLGGHRRFLLDDVLAVAEQMANPTPLDTTAKSPNRPRRSPEK